ncbi:response regulator [Hymenobacter norwichensis]|uniref:response regulator n=1 Tax=Hymenobacter norwichensis TaxID=223903 RepID=UPI0003B3455B|nr:response regulator [Hymenobacter norwichensis]
MQIVLVDDEHVSIFITRKMLEREGLADEIHTFELPEEALRYVQSKLPGHAPNVILLDLNMPGLDGWAFLEALQPYEAQLLGQCFIYILTSSLDPTDTVRANEFPLVSGLIHKPLDRIQIRTIFDQVVTRQS